MFTFCNVLVNASLLDQASYGQLATYIWLLAPSKVRGSSSSNATGYIVRKWGMVRNFIKEFSEITFETIKGLRGFDFFGYDVI